VVEELVVVTFVEQMHQELVETVVVEKVVKEQVALPQEQPEQKI
tara:strand:- start:759 stop:890 length:132 start_codon:yes stop_codon:yes gene_type:complete